MAQVASDLAIIRTTVRRLTRKLSENELSTDDIDTACNTFLLYDFPMILRLEDQRKTFSFETSPNVDTYYTNPSVLAIDQMADFKNLIYTSSTPVYIDGYRATFDLSEANFFRLWPKIQAKQQLDEEGDGTTRNFTGNLADLGIAAPVAPRLVEFSSVDATGVGQTLIDEPLVSALPGQYGVQLITGNMYDPRTGVKVAIGTTAAVSGNFSATVSSDFFKVGQLFSIGNTWFTVTVLGTPATLTPSTGAATGTFNTTTGALVITGNADNPLTTVYFYSGQAIPYSAPTVALANNTINYVTGAYNITFTVAPADGELIYAHTFPYTAGRPTSVLFFDNRFTVRPIPDDSYTVTIEAYTRPTELLSSTQEPDIEQYWQFIAYGTAIKILQWFTDFDTVEQLRPEFERQQLMVLSRTLVQSDDERSATIFNQAFGPYIGPGYGNWWNN